MAQDYRKGQGQKTISVSITQVQSNFKSEKKNWITFDSLVLQYRQRAK